MTELNRLTVADFLNQPVEVSADVFTIKGRLLKVVRSIESHGAIGDVLLENDGHRILIIGRSVVAIKGRR